MEDHTITGEAAGAYLRAWFCTGSPSHRGLNARALTRDALAACRDSKARRRLSLAHVSRRARPVTVQPQVSTVAARASARPVVRARAVAPPGRAKPRPRLVAEAHCG